MSYTKKTWHDGDTITAAGLNNMETGIKNNETAAAAAAAAAANAAPLLVPFEIIVDGQGNMSATTTADYATVRAAVIAGRTVIADVTAPGNMKLRVQTWGYSDTDLFFAVLMMPNSGATQAEYYSVYWSASEILFRPKTVPLT